MTPSWEANLQRPADRTSAPLGRGLRLRLRDLHAVKNRVRFLLPLALLLALAACATPMTPEPQSPPEYATPLMGAFVPTGFWNDLNGFKELEERVGGEFDLGHWYTSWSHAYDPVPVNDLLEHGRIPLVSWQSHVPSVADIAAGLHDDYVRDWARQAAAAPGVLYVRPFPEMNGDWAPWHGDPENLKRAWRRLVTLFKEEGAHNVRWVFSPNVTDEPRTQENRMENYYPGTEYVDVLALDGYNWGSTRPYIGWRSFDEVFATGYERITALGPQPVWIPEVASTEHGGDKAQWITDMLSSTAFGRLEAIIWFNEDKETDWRIESSVASAEAFREWFEWRAADEGQQIMAARARVAAGAATQTGADALTVAAAPAAHAASTDTGRVTGSGQEAELRAEVVLLTHR